MANILGSDWETKETTALHYIAISQIGTTFLKLFLFKSFFFNDHWSMKILLDNGTASEQVLDS